VLDQYRAHVDVLVSALLQPLDALEAALDRIDSGRPVGEVYTECRLADDRIALVGRIWEWFRAKLDQRDDAVFGPVLAAADEVLWSCYAGVFDNAAAVSGREVPRGLVPLPYIELGSGSMVTRQPDAPTGLIPDRGDEFVNQFLARLPLGLIGLPLAWVEAPWWLLLLGHEVGHHLQFDLVPESGLVREFGDLIGATADVGAPQHVAWRWRTWSQEIFADLCLLCAGGPWGIWSVVELALADQRTMSAERGSFPPPVTRLALLSAAATTLGVDGPAGQQGMDLGGLVADATGAATSDLALAPQIARAALGHRLGGLGTFAELFAFNLNDFRPGGTVQKWARALRAPGSFVHDPPLRSGRLIACGAVAAWSEVAAIADAAERENARAVLRETLLRQLTQGKQEAMDGATRAAEPSAVPDPSQLVEELGQRLVAKLDQLEGELAQLKGTLGRTADSGGSGNHASWRVFVSHTSELRDFPKDTSYVAAVERAISACGHVIVDMADFPAADQAPAELCRERVRGCQVYVGVLGTRYGSPVQDMPKVSYTELEFQAATEAGLDRLVFLLDSDAVDLAIPPSSLMDHKFGSRQEAFRRRVRKAGLVTQTFTNPATLGQLVERSLRELAETRRRRGSSENPGGRVPAGSSD
jgi:hypothetical protein